MDRKLLPVLLLTISSCCTKVDCEQTITPYLNINADGFSAEEKESSQLYRYRTDNNAFVDSSFIYQGYYDVFSPIYLESNSLYWYVLRISSRTNTIDNIRFDLITKTVKCNSCFPPGINKEKERQTHYVNLQFDLNGATVAGKDVHVVK